MSSPVRFASVSLVFNSAVDDRVAWVGGASNFGFLGLAFLPFFAIVTYVVSHKTVFFLSASN